MFHLITQKPLWENVILFDANCGVCSGLIKWVKNNDTSNKLHFIPLQSNIAVELLAKNNKTTDMNTVYFIEKGKFYDKSTAALKIVSQLTFPLNLGIIFLVVPIRVRDYFYDLFAARRYIFGKKTECYITQKSKQ